MPDRTVRIRYVADTSSVTKGAKDIDQAQERIGRSIKTSSLAVAAAGAAIGAAIFKVATSSVRAFQEAEQVQAGLQSALLRTGQQSDTVTAALAAQQEQLQALTAFDDEAIASAQSMGITFGLTAAQVERLTPAVLDLATVLGTDVPAAQKMLDLALAGNIRALKQLGIEGFKASGDRAADLDQILGLLRTKIEGAAEAAANTSAGGMKQMRNAMENIQESIGAVLVRNVLPSFLSGLFSTDIRAKNLAQTMNALGPRIEAAGASIGNAARTVGTLIHGIGSLIGWLNALGNNKAFAFIFGGGEAGAGPDIIGRAIERIAGRQIFMRSSVESATDALTDQTDTFVAGLDPLDTYGEAIEDTGKKTKKAKAELSEATKAAARLGEEMTSAFESATSASHAYDSIVVPDLEDSTKAWEELVSTVEDAQKRLQKAMSPATADDLRSVELDVFEGRIALAKATEKAATVQADATATDRDREEAQIDLERAGIRLRDQEQKFQDLQRKGTALDADVVEAKGAVREATDRLNDATVKLQYAQAGITPELLLDALRKQQEGAQQWASSLVALSHMGIDQGILKELARLGPEGLPKVQAFFDFVSTYGSGALNGLVSETRGALDRALNVFPEVRPAMEAVARQSGEGVGDAFGGGVAKTSQAQIKAAVEGVFDAFRNIKALVGNVPALLVGGPPGWNLPSTGAVQNALIPLGRQRGGPVRAGHPYWVGERGPEPFIPSQNGTILPHGTGLGTTVNVYVSGMIVGTQAELGETIKRALIEFERRGG